MPAVRTSNPSDISTIEVATNVVQSGKCTPAKNGTRSSTARTTAPPPASSNGDGRVGRVRTTESGQLRTRRLGKKRTTTNSTMNGRAGDTPSNAPPVNHLGQSADRT